MLLSLIGWVLGAEFRQETEAARKYKALLGKAISSPNGVIQLDSSEAMGYLAHPRGYDLLLFLTTRGCGYCPQIQSAFEEAAGLYAARQAFRPRRRRSAALVRRPLFFAVVALGPQSQALIGRYGVKAVPTLLYAPPAEARIADARAMKDFADGQMWTITQREGRVDLPRLLEWVNARAGEEVRVRHSPLRLARVMLTLAALLGALLALYAFCPGFVLNERVWLVAGLGVFVACAGGCSAALLSGARLFEHSAAGPVFIKRGTRAQTVSEGFIVMGAVVAAGGALVAAAQLLRRGRARAAALGGCLLVAALALLLFVEGVFRTKNFYSPMLFPPRYFIRGPLLNDYGTVA